MATDTTDLAARIRAHIAALPVPPGSLAGVLARTRRPGRVRAALVPALAGLAVVLVLFAAGIAPGLTGPGGHRPGGGPASLPRTVARYSYLTGSVSASPPGRAIMLYQQGYGVELFDFPQALVLGADGDVYRRVDAAERRSGGLDQGDPAPMLLSADGTAVAVGSNAGAGELVVLDLTDGRTRKFKARPGTSIRPLAWAPDGTAVVAQEAAGELNPYGVSGSRTAPLVRFDLTAGTVHRYDLPQVSAAAYSPDGTELAVQNGGALVVVDPGTGAPRRTLDTGGLPLTTAAAWSPDGRLLAVGPALDPVTASPGVVKVQPGIGFVDATGAGGTVPARYNGTYGPPLGWTSGRAVLVQPTALPATVVELDLWTGRTRTMLAVDTGPAANYQLGQVQFAAALLPGVRSRPAGSPDRGVWPTWAMIGTTLTLAVPVLLLVLRRRRRRGAG